MCACVCVFLPPRAPCRGLRVSDRVHANLSCMSQSPRLHPCPATASATLLLPSSLSLLSRNQSVGLPLLLPSQPVSVFISLLTLFPHLSFSLFWLHFSIFSCLPSVLFFFLLSFNSCDHSAQPSHPHIFLIVEAPPAHSL